MGRKAKCRGEGDKVRGRKPVRSGVLLGILGAGFRPQ